GNAVTLSGNNSSIDFSGTGIHDIAASTGTLRLGAVTLNGSVLGNNQTISGLGNVSLANQSELRLGDTGSNYVALRSPATLSGNYTLTFPLDDGLNQQALITDGNG